MIQESIVHDVRRLALGAMAVIGVALAAAVAEPMFLALPLLAGLNEAIYGLCGRCPFHALALDPADAPRHPRHSRPAALLAGVSILIGLALAVLGHAWALAVPVLVGLDYVQSAVTRVYLAALIIPGRDR